MIFKVDFVLKRRRQFCKHIYSMVIQYTNWCHQIVWYDFIENKKKVLFAHKIWWSNCEQDKVVTKWEDWLHQQQGKYVLITFGQFVNLIIGWGLFKNKIDYKIIIIVVRVIIMTRSLHKMNLGCRYILVNSVHHNTLDFVIASVLVICLY